MCGIIAYKGGLGLDVLVKGLKRLEYRGYDSWGIAWKRPGGIAHVKQIGTVQTIPNHMSNAPTIAIGHTRWATHGGVSQENAHPHVSYDERLAIVHNGIIENHAAIRARLQAEGITFSSDTDTETVANLLAHHWKTDFATALQKTLKELEGSYALVILQRDSGALWYARCGSPLIIGFGNGSHIGSDTLAFDENVNEISYVGENEFGYVDDDIHAYSLETGLKIEKEREQFAQHTQLVSLGSYKHYMHKEIMEQPRTIAHAINQEEETWKKAVSLVKHAFGLFLVGCGTSYHACIEAEYLFAKIAKKHVNTVLASEFEHMRHFLTPHTVMIALSQSGETADVLDAVRTAKQAQVKIISIVNVTTSTLARLSDIIIPMYAGPEQSVLSTKSFTAQLSIALALAGELGGKNIKQELRGLHFEVGTWLKKWEEYVVPLVELLKERQSCYLIGRGTAYPIAREAALKLKEGCYVHAEGFAAGELKHGTLALIEPKTVVIALVTPETRSHMLSSIAEVKARGATVCALDAVNDASYDIHIPIPESGITDPLNLIIPLQLAAYHLAVKKGINPDRPRNLAKSVTVR